MAISRKGSRPITVVEHRPLWRIRRKATCCQSQGWTPLTIAVASAAGTGSTLVLNLNVTRPDAYLMPSKVSITPADVARFVRQAMADGWNPTAAGKPLVKAVTLR